jgi:hypothetical protein
MVRESNNQPQNSYTAKDWKKHKKKGVWSSFHSRKYMNREHPWLSIDK